MLYLEAVRSTENIITNLKNKSTHFEYFSEIKKALNLKKWVCCDKWSFLKRLSEGKG